MTSQSSSQGSKSRISEWKRGLAPRLREWKYSLRLLLHSPLVVLGLVLLIVIIGLALLAPFIAPFGPMAFDWSRRYLPPGPVYLLGTDEAGGDIYSRILWGAQVDISSAIVVVASALAIGIPTGAIAAYRGGVIDEILMRTTDIFLSFPALILVMAIAATLGRNWNNLVLAMIVVWWPGYTRIVRGQVLAEREKAYVEAARSIGAGSFRIMFRHILPNCIAPMLVQATMDIGAVILTAAGLSFIGSGAQPGAAEWGRMVADGRNYMYEYPWIALFPGIAILLTSLAFNLVGDGLRDVLDPRLRR